MIDQSIQEELRKRYNPEGSELRKIQLQILDILKIIDSICRRNDITYWLGSGTLLGAVRHGGYIPWDDDIDIEILRKDRNRFIEACLRELPKNLHIQYHNTEPNYYLNILKVRDDSTDIGEKINMGEHGCFETNYRYRGCFVDIFCVEPCVPLFLKISNFLLGRVLDARYIKRRSATRCNYLWRGMELCNAFFRLLGVFLANPKVLYPGYSSCFGDEFGYSRDNLFPVKRMMFENVEVTVPSNPDGYLIEMYGNYMEMPSEESRSSHHSELEDE